MIKNKKGQSGLNKVTGFAIIILMIGILFAVGINVLSGAQTDIQEGRTVLEDKTIQVVIYNSTRVAFNSDTDTQSCNDVVLREVKMNKLVTSEANIG